MSTKTTFKRVALATVAVMGFGLLSVVPANAADGDITAVVTAGTLPTGQAVAGTAITVSPTIATSAISTSAAGATFTTTANVSAFPAYSAITAATVTMTSSVATKATTDANGTVAAAVATGNSTTTGAKITFTQVSATAAQTAAVMGAFSFTPDVAGYYEMTLTQTKTNATAGGTATATTASIVVGFTVSGGALIQIGSSAAPKTTGTQVTGRDATAVFLLPQSAVTTSRFKVSSTGASITGVFLGANKTNAVDATTYTDGATGIVKNDGTTFAQGVTFQPARAGQAPTVTGADTNSFAVRFTSAVAGAGNILVQSVDAATGVLTTVGSVTVTFGAVAVVSPSQSTAFIGQGSTRPTAVETAVMRVPSTAGVTMSATATTGATIAVQVNDTDGTALVNQAITATITGAGLITLASGAQAGVAGTVRTASLTATTMANLSAATIGVSADGTRGVGTITITAGGVTIATKTVTFYGAVATLTATQAVGVMGSGRTAASTAAAFTLGSTLATQTPAEGVTATTAVNIRIVAADVDGNVVPLAAAPTADISDALVIGAVTITTCISGTHASTTVCAAGDGNYLASTTSAIGGVSGAKATVTFKTPHPTVAGTFISTAAVPFTLGGTALGGTVTMTLNKAAYEPGERMIITYTAKDAAGNPVRDWSAVGLPASNKAINGLNGTAVFVAGSHIYGDGSTELTYAPTAPGAFTLTLQTGTATGATITATATVADDAATGAANAASDAAAEAIDAANAATDAANLAAEAADAATVAAEEARDAADAATAAVEALATEVATLMAALKAQITTLANTVAKIAKKVKA